MHREWKVQEALVMTCHEVRSLSLWLMGWPTSILSLGFTVMGVTGLPCRYSPGFLRKATLKSPHDQPGISRWGEDPRSQQRCFWPID